MRHHNLQVTGSVVVNGLGVATASELTAYTASTDAKISTLQAFTASTSGRLNSIESVSASNIARLSALETTSASVDTLNTSQNNRLNSIEIKTGSLATTGSNTFIGTQTITGSLFISANLIVQGTSSLENITASAVSIGTNIVNLNTANPAIRYAGLVIGDSGSVGGSGSFLYDSVQDEMIFIHRGNSTVVTSSVILMGPQTYDTIGTETYPTSNIIQKGTGNEHLVDSCIFDNGTTTCVKNNLIGTGNATFSSCIITGGDSVVCNSNIKTFSNTYGSTGLLRMYGTDGCEKYQQGLTTGGDFYQYTFSGLNHIFYTNGTNERMRISSAGNISVGRCDEMYKLNVFNDVTKTCTTARGLAFFGSNDALASAPFGLVITSQGGATVGDRIVRMGTTDFGLANGGTLELNGALFICNSGNVGIRHGSPENALHVCINSASTGVTIAQFENKDYTAGTRSYARVRGWLNAGASYSSYFGQGQDGKTYIYANNTGRCGDIVIDGTTGYVGVGTNVPTLQMHIHSATNDYNTIFSTSCVCGRAGWVIARPGSTAAIASALVLASDCSYRLGGGSYYNIKMLQDGSTTILNTSEGNALKVNPNGMVGINTGNPLYPLHIDAGTCAAPFYIYGTNSSYTAGFIANNGGGSAGMYFDASNGDFAGGDYMFIGQKENLDGNIIMEGSAGNFLITAGGSDVVTVKKTGDVYLGPGFGATNHRIDKSVSQGNNVLVVSGYNGSSNDTAIFYGVSGAGGNAAATAIWVATNTATGRSINAGGSITGAGNDYAEYIVKRCDTGCIQKGQIVGIDSYKSLTDKWSLAQSFVVKSTEPSFVGGDVWDRHLGKRPQRTEDVSEEEFAPIMEEFENKLEEARNTVDRISFSGQVPVIVSGSYNVGDYILPIEGPDDTIVGVACSLSNLTLEDYGKTIGKVWGTCLDKAWVAVKIG